MPEVRVFATPDSVPLVRKSTHVDGFFSPLEFTIDFTGWQDARRKIVNEVYSRCGDGWAVWLWGLYGTEDGRTFKYKLYDYWKGTSKADRENFERLLSRRAPPKLLIKAKWSWAEQDPLARNAQTSARNLRKIMNAKATVAEGAGNASLIEYHRNPRSLEDALIGCTEIAACIRDLGEKWKRPNGAKIIAPPELFDSIVEAVECDGSPSLQARHVVASDEYVEFVRQAVAGIPSKDGVKEKSIKSIEVEDREDEFLPLTIKHGFLHFNIPSSLYSMPSMPNRSAP